MNCSQRRSGKKEHGTFIFGKKKEQEKKEPVYTLKESDIEAIREEARKKAMVEATDLAVMLTLGLPVMVLGDKWGASPKELKAFTDDIINLYDSFDKGYISLEDITNTLKEEAGITFKGIIERRKEDESC